MGEKKGDPAAVNFSVTDRYCLDGQRLLPADDRGFFGHQYVRCCDCPSFRGRNR